jgi:phosphoribosyl 1,2-cyclic phosphodiesterase
MRIRFWGTRGSLPVALTAAEVRRRILDALQAAAGRNLCTPAEIDAFVEQNLPFATSQTYGGNTSCVQIDTGTHDYLVCDLGTGARPFGQHVLAQRGSGSPATFHVFMSHTHWDHIMGFPFFAPAYQAGNRIVIYGGHDNIEQVFRTQHSAPYFPVEFDELAADISFVKLEPGRRERVAGVDVIPKKQRHSGDSYGYRFEHAGKAMVYSTDSEHRPDDARSTQDFVDFFREADLVIFDAMYSLAEAVSIREDWGHSSNIVGVELCQLARVKHLCMFHHEPVASDDRIAAVLQETQRLEEITRSGHRLRISSAWDGLEISV